MPCMKRVYRDKEVSVHWSAARNEKRFSSRWFNAGFVPLPVYIGCRLFVFLGRHPGQLSSNPRRARWTVVSWAKRPACVSTRPRPPGPAPPPCVAPARPPRGMSGFWIRQVYIYISTYIHTCMHARMHAYLPV